MSSKTGKTVRLRYLAVSLMMGSSGIAWAALTDCGDGMIYDDVLDITWLQDANTGGPKTWWDAQAWAGALTVGNFDDWRLPQMDRNGDGEIVDCWVVSKAACLEDNELGYMFYYNLGGALNVDLTGNRGPFLDIQSWHWSATVYPPPPTDNARIFSFGSGGQDFLYMGIPNGAWAVRAGGCQTADSDSDGIPDATDNCIEVANAPQRDTDADGIGNLCDPDVAQPNDCAVNFPDLNVYKANFFAAGDLDTDNNGDGQTNFSDLNIVKSFFFGPPGPSAAGCN